MVLDLTRQPPQTNELLHGWVGGWVGGWVLFFVYAQDAIVQAPNIWCLEAHDAPFRGEREEKESLPTKAGAFENLTSEQIGEGIAAKEARGRGQTKDGDEYASTGEREGVSD